MSIQAMSHVWKHSKQKNSRLLLLIAIADNANDDGFAWPSEDTLAGKIRSTKRNTQRLIDVLETSGELIVYNRVNEANTEQHYSNVYRIPMPGVETAEPPELRGLIRRRGVVTNPSLGSDKNNTTVVTIPTSEPSLEPSPEPSLQKEERLVPSGTDGNSAVEETTLDNHATRLEAVRKTLELGEDSYPLAAKYLQFLTGCVPEKDSKHRDNGDWHAYQLQRGMDAAEITAFGLWLMDEYEGEPLRKPAALLDYAGRFRADSDHALYMQRAKLRLSVSLPEPPPEPEPAAVISEAQQADVLATLAALTEKVST